MRIVPTEVDAVTGAPAFASGGAECHRLPLHHHLAVQGTLFPLLQVAHQAEPSGVLRLLEVLCIVGWEQRFQAEHLDQCTGLLAEVEASLDHAGVVEHHQLPSGNQVGQMGEAALAHLAVAVDKQLGVVALG